MNCVLHKDFSIAYLIAYFIAESVKPLFESLV